MDYFHNGFIKTKIVTPICISYGFEYSVSEKEVCIPVSDIRLIKNGATDDKGYTYAYLQTSTDEYHVTTPYEDLKSHMCGVYNLTLNGEKLYG